MRVVVSCSPGGPIAWLERRGCSNFRSSMGWCLLNLKNLTWFDRWYIVDLIRCGYVYDFLTGVGILVGVLVIIS